MIEQEMTVELSLSVRRKVFYALVVLVLGFACAVYFIGQAKIALIIFGVGIVFAIVGFLSLRSQAKRESVNNNVE